MAGWHASCLPEQVGEDFSSRKASRPIEFHDRLDELGQEPSGKRREKHRILDQTGKCMKEFPRHGGVSFTGGHSFVKPAKCPPTIPESYSEGDGQPEDIPAP